MKNPPANAGDVGLILGSGRFPGEGMATHSSTIVWEILWTEEPGGLQFMWLQKPGRDLATKQHKGKYQMNLSHTPS